MLYLAPSPGGADYRFGRSDPLFGTNVYKTPANRQL